MSLPVSGQLSIGDIATEIYGSISPDRSLSSMSTLAGFSPPDAVSDFYGFTWELITLTYGTPIVITSTATVYDYYANVIRTNHNNPNIITINIPWTVYGQGTYGVATFYYRMNGGAWNQVQTAPNAYFAGTLTITNIDYNDSIDVRQRIVGSGQISLGTMYGSVTSGVGTVTGSGNWTTSFNV